MMGSPLNQTQTFQFIDEFKDRMISQLKVKSLCAKFRWGCELNVNQLN